MAAHNRVAPGPAGETTTDNPDELFDRVDANDRVIGQVRRRDAHLDAALIHRSVQVLIFNDAGEVLLQRRSPTKDTYPGYYCASASGHVVAGDTYDATAAREVREELGIETPLVRIDRFMVEDVRETELTTLYVGRHNGPFAFHPTETRGGAFYLPERALSLGVTGELPLTPTVLSSLQRTAQLSRTGVLRALLDGL